MLILLTAESVAGKICTLAVRVRFPGGKHFHVVICHEIFSTAIYLLPLFQVGQLSVTGMGMQGRIQDFRLGGRKTFDHI